MMIMNDWMIDFDFEDIQKTKERSLASPEAFSDLLSVDYIF